MRFETGSQHAVQEASAFTPLLSLLPNFTINFIFCNLKLKFCVTNVVAMWGMGGGGGGGRSQLTLKESDNKTYSKSSTGFQSCFIREKAEVKYDW